MLLALVVAGTGPQAWGMDTLQNEGVREGIRRYEERKHKEFKDTEKEFIKSGIAKKNAELVSRALVNKMLPGDLPNRSPIEEIEAKYEALLKKGGVLPFRMKRIETVGEADEEFNQQD